MKDKFILAISFEGKEIELRGRLLKYGYTVKLEVEIEATLVVFEPDEEGNWRAVISYENMQSNKKLNPSLLKAIAEEIQKITE